MKRPRTRQRVAVVAAAVGMALVISPATARAANYDGSYTGSWQGSVANAYGSGSGSGSLTFTVTNGTVSGSTGSGSFTGSVNASGAGSGSGSAVVQGYHITCNWSGQFVLASDGSVNVTTGKLTNCHDTDGFGLSGSGSFSASRPPAGGGGGGGGTGGGTGNDDGSGTGGWVPGGGTETGTDTGNTGSPSPDDQPGPPDRRASCLETATCIVPFLREPELIRGTAQVEHADGTSEPLAQVTGFRHQDVLRIGRQTLLSLDFAAELAPAGSLLAQGWFVAATGVGSAAMAVTGVAAGGYVVLNGLIASADLMLQLSRAQVTLTTPNAIVAAVERSGVAPPAKRARSLQRARGGSTPRARAAAGGAMFTVEARRGYTRVRAYKRSVKVSSTRGRRKRSVIVKAGRETVVRGPRPPTNPRRFKPPKRPFWWKSP